MREIVIPTSQLEDSAAEFGLMASRQAGDALYQPDTAMLPNPGYDQAARVLQFDARQPVQYISPVDDRLNRLAGLRVLAAVQTRDRKSVYLPGVILPDIGVVPRIGCLQGPDIVQQGDVRAVAARPLEDLQQVYLEQMLAMHGKGVGEHAQGTLNVADIGHAALIASTGSHAASGIENKVHDFVARGLSKSVADTGALNVQVGHTVRHIREVVLPARQAAHLIVARQHQMPSSARMPAAQLAVGVTLAAVRSKRSSYPQPDIATNVRAMVGGR
ncbi:MAG TPA: hypothetical protein VD735_02730 [Candidatus Saccharimonadales bacterium]|nr:hypothetical protein [Candidatus Saccharimonadales bacterium]